MLEIKITLQQVIDSIPLIKWKDTLSLEDLKKYKIDLNQIVEINNNNYDSTIELSKNEIFKYKKIKDFNEITNWNYEKQGIYLQYFLIEQENQNCSIAGFIECSKKTKKKISFYITIATWN